MTDIVNTLSTYEKRIKYMKTTLQDILKSAVVAEKICKVDNSDLYTIQNPYGSTPTATVSGLTGTYTVATYTITDDALTVSEEVKVGEHIYRFESIISQFDLYASRMEAHAYSVALAIDKYVLNMLCEAGTGSYSTPSGGFATAANVLTILANLSSKTDGYALAYQGKYLVVENSDMVGIVLAGATNGFNTADAVLNNGQVGRMLGFDIYVVRDSTFTTVSSADSTSGTQTWSNDGHRVAGVKGVSTYASPRGVAYTEKPVSEKSGMEILTECLIGFKQWTNTAALTIDITVTA